MGGRGGNMGVGGRSGGRVVALTVRRPRETVPTNLRLDIGQGIVI
jgi:hypothetical protein